LYRFDGWVPRTLDLLAVRKDLDFRGLGEHYEADTKVHVGLLVPGLGDEVQNAGSGSSIYPQPVLEAED
jgi:hypothetical protein